MYVYILPRNYCGTSNTVFPFATADASSHPLPAGRHRHCRRRRWVRVYIVAYAPRAHTIDLGPRTGGGGGGSGDGELGEISGCPSQPPPFIRHHHQRHHPPTHTIVGFRTLSTVRGAYGKNRWRKINGSRKRQKSIAVRRIWRVFRRL